MKQRHLVAEPVKLKQTNGMKNFLSMTNCCFHLCLVMLANILILCVPISYASKRIKLDGWKCLHVFFSIPIEYDKQTFANLKKKKWKYTCSVKTSTSKEHLNKLCVMNEVIRPFIYDIIYHIQSYIMKFPVYNSTETNH